MGLREQHAMGAGDRLRRSLHSVVRCGRQRCGKQLRNHRRCQSAHPEEGKCNHAILMSER